MIATAAALSSGLAYAGDGKATGDHNYISVLPTYVIPDSDRRTTRQGGGISVVFGHLFTEHLGLEIAPTASIFNTGKGKGTDFYEYGGTIDLSYSLFDRVNSEAVLNPFFVGGVGGVYDDVQPSSRKKGAFIADAGLGLVSRPFYHGIRFRAEARYVHDFYTEFKGAGFNDYRGSLGIEIPLGRTVERTITLPPEHVEIREVVKEVPKPFVDSDGDTVPDDLDKCPDTPKGLKVDAEGCVIPDQVIELRGVTFEFNKSRLTPNAGTVLDSVVKAFIGQPSLKVEIGGHTDSKGSDAYNLKLSQARAEAVKSYLVGKGAKPDQLVAKGYGESQLLIKPETSEDDRELNRRVEFKVIK
ncbi:MAG: OmpA family protein [Nevskia sp.]